MSALRIQDEATQSLHMARCRVSRCAFAARRAPQFAKLLIQFEEASVAAATCQTAYRCKTIYCGM